MPASSERISVTYALRHFAGAGVLAMALFSCEALDGGGPATPANGEDPSGESASRSPDTSGAKAEPTSGDSGESASSAIGAGTESSSTSDGGRETDGNVTRPPPVGCYDYGAFRPRVVHFAADVMPIFQARCASCHNSTAESTYYGSNKAAVYDKLLNGTPKQAPHLRFVAPNDPLRSYMLAKVEYSKPGGTCSVVQCNAPGCELSAPPGKPLPESERAVLRSWIMTGAAND